MYRFKRIFILDLMNLITNPMWIFYAIGFPIALVLILGFLTSGSYGGSVSSYDYFGVALMVFGIFNAATFSANSFMEERIKKPNMRLIHSPLRPFNIYFSKIVASAVFCTVAYALVAILLQFIVGINYGGTSAWALLVILLASNFFFSALGVLVCCILKNEGTTNNILSLLFMLLSLFGGVFFPVDGLGKVVVSASWLSPARWILTACMRIIYDRDLSLFLPVLGMFILFSVVAVALCGQFFKGEDYI